MSAEEMPSYEADDEISLLDLLLVVVENLRLLLLGPLLVGLLAFGLASLSPNKYQSEFSQLGDQQMLNYYLTDDTVAATIGQLKLKKADEDIRSSIARFRTTNKAAINKKNGLLELTAEANNPEDAKKTLEVWIEQAKMANSFRLERLKRMEAELALAKNRAAQFSAFVSSLKVPLGPTDIRLINEIREAESAVAAQGANLAREQRFDVVQPPTLATKPLPRKRALTATIAALAAGFALLLFVFVRQALRKAALDPESAEKISQLRAAWRRAIGRPTV